MQDNQDDIVINQVSGKLTYIPWYQHPLLAIQSTWKQYLSISIAIFAILWGLIEAVTNFFPNASFLKDIRVLISAIVISSIFSLFRSISLYRNAVPASLSAESKKIQSIIRHRKEFWEFELSLELIKEKTEKIDNKINNLLSNRIHIDIVQVMTIEQYVEWLGTRIDTLTSIVNTTNQLLINDLLDVMLPKNGTDLEIEKLLKTRDLIEGLYENTYNYVASSKRIKIPGGFETVHTIQCEWVCVIQDLFHQALDILKDVSSRKAGDYEMVDRTITTMAPPRMDEYCAELDRLNEIYLESQYSST